MSTFFGSQKSFKSGPIDGEWPNVVTLLVLRYKTFIVHALD